MIVSRRYDLDWLRVIAFGVLIYFHSAIIFLPHGIPQIHNAESSEALHWFVSISHHFRLALLFFISGIGVGFARRRRTDREFVTERSKRLLIPFAFAVVTIVPAIVYFEKVFQGSFTGTFFEFYPQFTTNGVYPAGHLSWHHMWFIAYLYLYCIIGMKLYGWLENRNSIHVWGRSIGIYGFILLLIIIEIPLRAIFPGSLPNLVTDWANFFHYFLIFLAGYVVSQDEKILDNAQHLRFVSLGCAIVSAVLLYVLFYKKAKLNLSITDDYIIIKYIGFCVIRMAFVWMSIMTCLGFASRFLNHPSQFLAYLNEAVYPLFILHLLVIVALAFIVVKWDMNLWIKYILITTGTIILVLGIYHYVIRPFNMMRLLFGVKHAFRDNIAKPLRHL